MTVLKVGERVELRDSIPGYEAGSRGVIVSSSNHGGVMVRFDETGHAMLLRSEEIRIIGT